MGPRVRGDDEGWRRQQRTASIFILHCGKKLAHSRTAGQASGVASHVTPDHAFRARSPCQSRRRRGGRPAADRYPAARAHSRRYRARPGRRRRVRPGRAHPADLDPVPPRRRQARAARTRTDPRQHVDQPDRAHRARLQLFLASRQHCRGPEQHPPDAGADRRRRGAARRACWPRRWRTRARPASARPICASFFETRPGQSGADRASDRSPPQEHDRPRDGDRRTARPPRAGAADAGRDRGERRAIAPRGADAVADQSVAPDQAHGARRGRQWPVVLRLHLPARGAAAALRAGRPAERGATAHSGRTGLVPEDGKLDRRRPRRQSVRDRRRDARHAAAAVEPGAALLSGGTARARRRTVAGGASGRCFQGFARAGGALAGQVAAPQRRALSPRGIRHLCAADRDRDAAGRGDHTPGGRRGRALRRCRGIQGRSRHPLSLADLRTIPA